MVLNGWTVPRPNLSSSNSAPLPRPQLIISPNFAHPWEWWTSNLVWCARRNQPVALSAKRSGVAVGRWICRMDRVG